MEVGGHNENTQDGSEWTLTDRKTNTEMVRRERQRKK